MRSDNPNHPAPGQKIEALSPMDECQTLGELRLALAQAITGRRPIETRYNERLVRYAPPNVFELRKQIAYLERRCNPNLRHASAVRVGGFNHRSGAYPFFF